MHGSVKYSKDTCKYSLDIWIGYVANTGNTNASLSHTAWLGIGHSFSVRSNYVRVLPVHPNSPMNFDALIFALRLFHTDALLPYLIFVLQRNKIQSVRSEGKISWRQLWLMTQFFLPLHIYLSCSLEFSQLILLYTQRLPSYRVLGSQQEDVMYDIESAQIGIPVWIRGMSLCIFYIFSRPPHRHNPRLTNNHTRPGNWRHAGRNRPAVRLQ
jgi:hypothetical protein